MSDSWNSSKKAQKIAAKLVCWHYLLITISATDPSKRTKGDFGEGHRTNDVGPVGECSFPDTTSYKDDFLVGPRRFSWLDFWNI